MRTILHSFLLFALASAGIAAEKDRESQIDNIREAVFRWQFGHNDSLQKTNAWVYFLQIGEERGDPTDDFIKRFAGQKPPVRKVSLSSRSVKGVVDKKTGERGLVFRFDSIVWKSDTEVQVKGGYFEDGKSASWNTYTVKRAKGQWNVTNDKLDEEA
jgi:hypothetical protein